MLPPGSLKLFTRPFSTGAPAAERQSGWQWSLPLLRDRTFDLILGRPPLIDTPLIDDIDAEALLDDPLVVVAGSRSHWTRRRKIDLAELIGEPWILSPRVPLAVEGHTIGPGCEGTMTARRASLAPSLPRRKERPRHRLAGRPVSDRSPEPKARSRGSAPAWNFVTSQKTRALGVACDNPLRPQNNLSLSVNRNAAAKPGLCFRRRSLDYNSGRHVRAVL
jgi:hypothetical protein